MNYKNEISVLPSESIYSICVCDDGSFLLGTDAGAVYIKNGLAKYLPATRYAFDTNVTALAFADGAIYTASEGGVVKTTEKLMTLEEKSKLLFENLAELKNNNAQGEYYLTDVPKILIKKGCKVSICSVDDNTEIYGVNTQEDLEFCEKQLLNRK